MVGDFRRDLHRTMEPLPLILFQWRIRDSSFDDSSINFAIEYVP